MAQTVKTKREFDNIPQELRNERRWVLWRLTTRHDRPTKVPYDAKEYLRQRAEGYISGDMSASSTDPMTWSSFDRVIAAYELGEFHGIGFVLGNGFVGIDQDKIPGRVLGEHIAGKIVDLLKSYTEVSPSGTGLHTIVKASVQDLLKIHVQKDTNKGLEIYAEDRYFTMTGNVEGVKRLARTENVYLTVETRQDETERFLAEFMTPKPVSLSASSASAVAALETDQDVLNHALTHQKFAEGFTGGWPDDQKSETVGAMVFVLARYSHDPDQLDRIMRQSDIVQNSHWSEKWDRLGPDQIRDAIAATEQVFQQNYLVQMASKVDELVPEYEPPEPPTPKPSPDAPESSVAGPDEFQQQLQRQVQEAAERAARPKHPCYTLEEMELLPPPQWHIRDHFSQGAFVVLFGPSGSGKSFVALDWSYSIATGCDFLGLHSVQKGSVAYVISEGQGQFRKRARGWLKHHKQQSTPDLKFIPSAFSMTEDIGVEELLETIRNAFDGIPSMIVIDTLTRNFVGDPNSTKDMQAFCNNVDKLRAVGATVVVVHHTGHTNEDRERNAKNLRDCADTSILVDKRPDKTVRICCKKQKDAEEFEPYLLEPVMVDVAEFLPAGDDFATTTLVMGFLEGEDAPQDDGLADFRHKVEKHIPYGVENAIKTSQIKEVCALPKRTLHRVLANAFNAMMIGRIGSEKTGFSYYRFTETN